MITQVAIAPRSMSNDVTFSQSAGVGVTKATNILRHMSNYVTSSICRGRGHFGYCIDSVPLLT